MISLNQNQSEDAFSRDPGIHHSLEFVSLAAPGSPPGGVVAPEKVEERPAVFAAQQELFREKFDVSWNLVKSELQMAVSASLLVLLNKKPPPVYSTSAITDVTEGHVGDWWGAIWTPLTLSMLIVAGRNANNLFYTDGPRSYSVLPAVVLALVWTLALTGLLRGFVAYVVRDPTFFGQNSHKQKLFSIAGYSLVPYTLAVCMDILLGLCGVDKHALWHFIIICVLPSLGGAAYISLRFPLQAIESFTPGFDRLTARSALWIGLLTIALCGGVGLQMIS
eukprot:Blabericola_migrator_1__4004@NODE_2216_length_3111_cov_68_766754_g1395_i0_p2_GENE_NODE_2216_length_3111_cov_68_766754_g1395_i0NODE_2216_length_3111_cov_68_766754_g1395_i0_p2_ORF_typecomplete_len278_score50_11Yip1/PF04893_17/0_001_NODE_2216_length_3111_cov_68_766754_g1395_i011832016